MCNIDIKDIDTTTEELHEEAGLLRLMHRRDQHMLNFMFDLSQSKCNVLVHRSEGAVTRSSKKRLMKVKRPKTEKI